MSINVTVKGNPVSIKRGTMVTSDAYNAKSEFDKRRLMRLEQVRQQSKEIAEDVRNKVRKEKRKQISEIEKEGKEKLKNWQTRKLMELQNQYKEALTELGVGHKEAEDLIDEDEILLQQQESSQQIAQQRGKDAANKLQIEKNKENFKHAKPLQQRKLARDIENSRSLMVSKIKKVNRKESPIKKKKKRRKASADINITIPASDTENDVPELTNFSSDSDDNVAELDLASATNQSAHSEHGASLLQKRNLDETSESTSRPKSSERSNINEKVSRSPRKSPSSYKYPKESVNKPSFFTEDTRISDRIKRREFVASQPDYCDLIAETNPVPLIESNTHLRNHIYSRHLPSSSSSEEARVPIHNVDNRCTCTNDKKNCGTNTCNFNEATGSSYSTLQQQRKPTRSSTEIPLNQKMSAPERVPSRRTTEIPLKPKIKLKDTKTQDNYSRSDTSKVHFYDHPNRFHKNVQMPSSQNVEKISTDSIEVLPNITSEEEFQRKMEQRDREAYIRGQKALERERVHRDYQDMLKRLPALQKQERIGEISQDRPEYHMSEERLQEQFRKKQNQLDNVYNRLFPQREPAIVTLPRKNLDQQRQTNQHMDSPPTLNVASWDVDHKSPQMFTAEEVQEIIKAFTDQNPYQRREKLKELLRSLKLQKEQLLQEFNLLPKNDSINQLIDDLHSFKEPDRARGSKHRTREKSKRKRSKDLSSASSSESTINSSDKQDTQSKDVVEQGSTKKKSPRKKVRKHKRKVLILQNMSTQTTPKPENKQMDGKDSKKSEQICTKLHKECSCQLEQASSEDICKIVIKLNDDKPEVIVDQIDKTTETKQRKSELPQKIAENEDKTKQEKILQGKVRDKSKDVVDQKPRSNQVPSRKRMETSSSVINNTSKAGSWKEQFSRNSINSSTSYYSPPDFSKTRASSIPSSTPSEKHSFYNLHRKPQQGNLNDISTPQMSQSLSSKNDALLYTYIKKLLGMSRGSIDNLTVSSSTVTTPGQSIVDVEANQPAMQLQNILRFLNIDPNDFQKVINTSNETQQGEKSTHSVKSQSNKSRNESCPEQPCSPQMSQKEVEVSSQYADITSSCSQRIANLTAKIQKLREEKMQILQSPVTTSSDSSAINQSETAYLELPESSKGSMDEEELQRRLLDIDFSLADKLRLQRKNEDSVDDTTPAPQNEEVNPHEELLLRLQRLIDSTERQKPPPNTPKENQSTSTEEQFVPLLLDIPKLPVLEVHTDLFDLNPSMENMRKRPPTSKGLTVARKFNGNISQLPHELSTIVEADSQLSTKMDPNSPQISTKTSKSSSKNVSPSQTPKSSNKMSEDQGTTSPQDKTLTDKSKLSNRSLRFSVSNSTSSNDKTSQGIIPDIISGVSDKNVCDDSTCYKRKDKTKEIPDKRCSEGSTCKSKKDSDNSSSSTSDLEAIEAMLRSIGMEWAIPTLHKTKEALALTSSSSSLDLTDKKSSKVDESTSMSDVNLREFLRRQAFNKISSSTLKTSDASPGSLLSEFSDMSSIQANTSGEKGQQRTSTPLISTSKSTNKSKIPTNNKQTFTGDSDLSSVRDNSVKIASKLSFHSLLSDASQSKNDL